MKVYIKAEESVCVNHAQVYLCDVLSLYCSDYETGEKLKKVRLYHFPSREKQRKIFSVLKVVEKIKEEDSQIEVVNMGPEDFVVSYEQKKEEKRWITAGKIIFVCLVAFFGASFSTFSHFAFSIPNPYSLSQLLILICDLDINWSIFCQYQTQCLAHIMHAKIYTSIFLLLLL